MTDTSIIISTYNGAHKIGRLLDALQKQTVQDFEIIVVVDGSTDNTTEVLRRYSHCFEQLKVIEQENSGRAKVKNSGAAEASGNLLIFYDDDMEPSAESVERHIRVHQKNKGVVGGYPVEYAAPGKSDIQNYKAHLTHKWTEAYPADIVALSFQNLFFAAANCSVERSIFFEIGQFDTRLTDAEDYDFAWRALEKNISVYFDKQNLAVHHDAITAQSYIRRQRQYNDATHRLRDLHPERSAFVTQRKISGVKKNIYNMMASPALVRMIDAGFFRRVLPERVRFKVYDLVIQSMAIEFPNRPI